LAKSTEERFQTGSELVLALAGCDQVSEAPPGGEISEAPDEPFPEAALQPSPLPLDIEPLASHASEVPPPVKPDSRHGFMRRPIRPRLFWSALITWASLCAIGVGVLIAMRDTGPFDSPPPEQAEKHHAAVERLQEAT
jgi:hypothetical protein